MRCLLGGTEKAQVGVCRELDAPHGLLSWLSSRVLVIGRLS